MSFEERVNHQQYRARMIMGRFGTDKVIGVETGVFSGALCSTMMPMYPNLFLYGVDPYREFSMRQSWPQERWDELHDLVINMMKPWANRWTLIRKPALEAVSDLPDNLDFVYLDDDHSYEALSAEIPVYEQKVRKGGILSGHDYNMAYPGVIKAVNDYAAAYHRLLWINWDVDMWWWEV